jgi:hypothetical protein
MAQWKTRTGRLRLAAALAALLLTGLAGLYPGWSQSPVFTEQVDIDQQRLQAGEYPLFKVLESGGQFFSTPYIPFDRETGQGDGYGEGTAGPRQAQIAAFYPPDAAQYPFLRLNGLDSQSCYECHNSIGSYVEPGSKTGALMRKPGSVGGSAGSNSNAFINPEFPDPITLFIRQPPHVFGTGYTQQIATEITTELSLWRNAARILAKKTPGRPVEVQLTSKGMGYGRFKTTFTGGSAVVLGCDDLCTGETPETTTFGETGFTDDVSQVTGVACDLIVRPFQWKGISSSIRHFARDAMDFHLSMQAVEKYNDLDCDRDGKRREVSLGNVSALVSFVTMTRPPQQILPEGEEARRSVALGEEIFRGKSTNPVVQARLTGNMCATCHVPSLRLNDPELFIDNPGPADVGPGDCKELDAGLVDPVSSHGELSTFQLVEARVRQVRPRVEPLATTDPAELAQALRQALEELDATAPPPGYRINLTRPGIPASEVPAYVYPRLKPRPNGSVVVPLFSDLKQHNMGVQLADRAKQGADVAGICIARPLFLTRPLWGVADTGPWLHDGRALTLKEAVLHHEGDGSEANPIIRAFRNLTPEEQQAVVDFLLTLRLPVQPGLEIQEYLDDPPEEIPAAP